MAIVRVFIRNRRSTKLRPRRVEIAAAHEKHVEKRAIEDHKRIEEINKHIDDIHQEVLEHITTSLDRIEKLMLGRIEQMQEEDHAHINETHNNVLATMASHKEELEDMRKILDSLRPPSSD